MSNEIPDLRRLLIESRETLLNPQEYFPSMELTGGYSEPVIKAAIYGIIAGLLSLLWTALGLSALGGSIWSGVTGITALISSIIGAIVAVFIGGGIMLIISAICGGDTDYEANVRVAASLMAIYPINAFMAFLYGINTNVGSFVGLAISLYSLYLLYHAAILALRGKKSSARIVVIVLVFLSLLSFNVSRKATNSMDDISDMFEQRVLD